MCVCVCVCVSITKCTGGGATIPGISSVSGSEIWLFFIWFILYIHLLNCQQQSNGIMTNSLFHVWFSRTINLTAQTASFRSARSLRRCSSGLCMYRYEWRFSLDCIVCGLFYDDALCVSPSRRLNCGFEGNIYQIVRVRISQAYCSKDNRDIHCISSPLYYTILCAAKWYMQRANDPRPSPSNYFIKSAIIFCMTSICRLSTGT